MRKWFSVALILALCLMVASNAMAATASPSKSSVRLTAKSLDSLAKKIVQGCTNSGMSQFEKAVALYDWLIDNTVYRGGTTNAYYVLKYGEASCGGYSNAYKVLLSKAGLNPRPLMDAYNLWVIRGTWSI